MAGEDGFKCPECSQPLDPNAPDTTPLRRVLRTMSLSGDKEWNEMGRAYFHAACSVRAMAPKPGEIKWERCD